MSRARFVRYLDEYAAGLRLPIRTNVDVVSVRRTDRSWAVETSGGGWRCAVLVIATGIASAPVTPPLPGLEQYRGRLRHSIDYREPGPFAGRRVLVVGAGNSGGEIAAELAIVAGSVSVAIRSGVVVVPREIAGIPSQYLGLLIRRLPRAIAEPIVGMATRRRARRLPAALPRSTASPLDEIPLIGMHLPDAIAAGTVRVRPGVVGFTTEAVQFADGSEERFDEVILATGFRAALQPLDGLVEVDGRGFARRTDRVTSADQPDLYFVGHEYDATGGLANIRRDAPAAARRIARALASRTGQSSAADR